MFLEDVGQLVLWLVLLVMSLNLVFLFFLLRRRLIRKRFFAQKDAARERYRDPVDAFVLGQIGLEQAAAALGDARSPAEREVVSEMLFAVSNPENTLAVKGLSRETIQLAKSRRLARCPPVSSCPRNCGIAGCTTSPESSIQFARGRIRVSRGVTDSDTSTLGISDCRIERVAFSRSNCTSCSCNLGSDH